MTEILIDADFGHPPERVWRALTDRALLAEWFMQTDLEPRVGHRFRMMPDGLLGFTGPVEAELVEVTAPRRLVMLWRGEQMHSRITWEVVPLPDGCRLRLSHTGFIGVDGTARRKELRRAYDRMLTDRLPRVLSRLAADAPAVGFADHPAPPGSVPPRPAPASPYAEEPGVGEPAAAGGPPGLRPGYGISRGPGGGQPPGRAGGPPGLRPGYGIRRWLRSWPHRRRGQLLAGAAAVLLAVLTTAVISSLGGPSFIPPFAEGPEGLPDTVLGTGGPSQGGVPPPRPASSGAAGGSPTGSPGAPRQRDTPDTPGTGAVPTPAPTGGQPAPASWHAAYRTSGASAGSFTGEVTVTNTGTAPASGWVVIVTLPDGARLTSVKRATASQSGTAVSLAAKNSGKVGPGASVTIEFEVTGGRAPTGCRIEGRDCVGTSA